MAVPEKPEQVGLNFNHDGIEGSMVKALLKIAGTQLAALAPMLAGCMKLKNIPVKTAGMLWMIYCCYLQHGRSHFKK